MDNIIRRKWGWEKQNNFTKIAAAKDRVIIKIQMFLMTETGISTNRYVIRVYEKWMA